jgi:hypothetical protein
MDGVPPEIMSWPSTSRPPKRKRAAAACGWRTLFDHLVGAAEQSDWESEAERSAAAPAALR